jgi:hypothetical protein
MPKNSVIKTILQIRKRKNEKSAKCIRPILSYVQGNGTIGRAGYRFYVLCKAHVFLVVIKKKLKLEKNHHFKRGKIIEPNGCCQCSKRTVTKLIAYILATD